MNISPVSFSGLMVRVINSAKITDSTYSAYSYNYTLPFTDELEKNPDDFTSFEREHVIPFTKNEFCQMTSKKPGDMLLSETYGISPSDRVQKIYTII